MDKLSRSSYSRTYFDLLEALRQPGCVVCRLVNDALLQHIDMFIYENINNLARREEIREARGFCAFHINLFLNVPGRLFSLAVLEQDVLANVLRDAGKVTDKPDLLAGLFGGARSVIQTIREALLPRRVCPLCDYVRGQETVMLGTLIQFIEDAEMRAAWEGSAGLCLPHYYTALGMPGKLDKIIQVEQAMLKELKTDIDAYVHKRNPAYEGEEMGREIDSPTRAAWVLAGRVVHTDGRF